MAVCAALVGAAAAVEAGSFEAESSPSQRADYRLANGLRVILTPDDRAREVSVVVTYDVGSAHDPRAYQGMAHLLEHLTFRGSRHLGPLEGVAILERIGAGYAAYTELEQTVYLTSSPPHSLETVLWIESERMGFALDGIDRTALDLEQRIVANELAERARNRERLLWHQRLRTLYGKGHPFAPPEDAIADLRAIELEGVQWFFQSTYRPDNATLVIAGHFAPGPAIELVEQYFGPIKNPPLPRLSVDAPAPSLCGAHRVVVGHPFLLGHDASFTWPLLGEDSPARRASHAALRLVLEQRLTEALVQGSFKAASVDVSALTFRTHGLLSVDIEMHDTAEWDFVENAVTVQVKRLAAQAITEQELRTVRAQLLSQHALAEEDGVRQALAAAEQSPAAEQEALLALDAAGVQAAARVLLGPRLHLRAKPSAVARREPLVLQEEKACP